MDGLAILGLPGCPDYADDLPPCGVGRIEVYRDGALIQTITATAENTHFGWFPVALGDVDGDGRGDLGVMATDAAYVYLGNGAGFAEPAVLLPPNHIYAGGDVDGDGAAEIVMIDSYTVTLYRGGPGGPSEARHEAIALPKLAQPYGEISAGDLDGDGFGDLAIQIQIDHGPVETLTYRGSKDGLRPDPS